MSRCRTCGCDARVNWTEPPASVALATRCRCAGVVPARTCRLAPCVLPSRIVTLVAVTVRPRSSSRPVPSCKLPNCAVVYQEVCHGVAGSPDSASEAFCALSPSEVPLGPNAAALTGFSLVSGITVGARPGLSGLEADAEFGCEPCVVAGVRAAGLLEDPGTGG